MLPATGIMCLPNESIGPPFATLNAGTRRELAAIFYCSSRVTPAMIDGSDRLTVILRNLMLPPTRIKRENKINYV